MIIGVNIIFHFSIEILKIIEVIWFISFPLIIVFQIIQFLLSKQKVEHNDENYELESILINENEGEEEEQTKKQSKGIEERAVIPFNSLLNKFYLIIKLVLCFYLSAVAIVFISLCYYFALQMSIKQFIYIILNAIFWIFFAIYIFSFDLFQFTKNNFKSTNHQSGMMQKICNTVAQFFSVSEKKFSKLSIIWIFCLIFFFLLQTLISFVSILHSVSDSDPNDQSSSSFTYSNQSLTTNYNNEADVNENATSYLFWTSFPITQFPAILLLFYMQVQQMIKYRIGICSFEQPDSYEQLMESVKKEASKSTKKLSDKTIIELFEKESDFGDDSIGPMNSIINIDEDQPIQNTDKEKEDSDECEDEKEDDGDKYKISYKRLLIEFLPEFYLIFPSLIINIINAFFEIGRTIMISICISIFSPNVDGSYSFFSNNFISFENTTQQFHALLITLLLLFIFGLIISCCYSVQSILQTIACEKFATRVRSKAIHSLLHQELGFFDDVSTGEMLTRITNDTNEIKTGMIYLSYAVYSIIVSICGIVLLLVISIKLSFVMVGLTPLVAISLIFESVYLAKFTKQKIYSMGKAGKVADEIINNVKIISTHSTQSLESVRYLRSIYKAYLIAKKAAYVEGISWGAIEFIFSLAIVVAIGAAGYFVINSIISIGEVVLYLMCVIEVMEKLGSFPQYVGEASKSFGSAGFIFTIIDRSPKIKAEGGVTIKDDEFEGKLELKNVEFKYPTRDITVLNDFNFVANSKEITSIVGQSGSGKTTVLSLLMRFYDVNEGEVLIDNHNIRNIDMQWMRSKISIVLQDSMLFSDTIFNNICYGDESPLTQSKIQRIIHSAKLANAHHFISLLPKKYNTIINKTSLSGGQRQRIAIARALYRNPKILFLDEFTSSLDSQNQKLVVDAIVNLMSGRTVVMISHNYLVTRESNTIFVMSKGKIVEQGDHQTLIEKGGLYSSLFRMQSIGDNNEIKEEIII